MTSLTRHAADSLRSPLMPRLGCRHPGVCCSSDSRMESKHLMALPNRAVAPGPVVGKERERCRGAPSVSSSREYLRADTSLHRPASPCPRPRTSLSRTLWRSNTSGPYAVAPRGTDRSSLPSRYCLRLHGFLRRPSTAGALQPAFAVFRLPEECSCSRQLQSPAVAGASPFSWVLEAGAPRSRAFAFLPVSLRKAPAPHPAPAPPGVSDNHSPAHAAQPNPSMQRTRYARR